MFTPWTLGLLGLYICNLPVILIHRESTLFHGIIRLGSTALALPLSSALPGAAIKRAPTQLHARRLVLLRCAPSSPLQARPPDAAPARPMAGQQDYEAAAEERARAQAARDAALARAADAEQEALLAQADRDAADARIRAARERAAANLPPPDDGDNLSDHAEDADAPDYDAIAHHEAAALLNLHAQAVSVQNIRALVPLLLDVTRRDVHLLPPLA